MNYYVDGAATPQFAKLMLKLADTLGARVDEEQVRSHAKVFTAEAVPYDDLLRMFAAAAREETRGFYPSPGKLLSYLRPEPDDAALIAWAALSRAADAAGAWAVVEIEDHVAAEALLQVFGGWPAFAQAEDGPALSQRRAEFLAAYRMHRRRGRLSAGPRRLPGLCGTPDQQLREHTFVARVLSDGTVVSRRDRPALAPPGEPAQIGERP